MTDCDDRRTRTCALVRELCARSGAAPRDELVDALFVAASRRGDWLAGISELSVSFRPGQPPAVRALAEVLRKQPLDGALVETGLAWGLDVLHRAAYDAGRFAALYLLIYGGELADPAPMFRFGIAAELGRAAPVVKVYFDLHAAAPGRRRAALAGVAELVGETAGLAAWARACPAIDLDTSRVIGVDFGPANAVRTKFYWGTRRMDWAAIRAAARELAGERHDELLDRLERDVVRGPPESSVLISMCGREGARTLKLDICIARLFEDDGRAHEAIERLCGRELAAPLAIVTGGLAPSATRCVQQYVGVELPPDEAARVTMYYRPLDLEAEHLNPALRPRRCA